MANSSFRDDHVVMPQPVSSDNHLRRRSRRSRGQGTAEYAVLLALVVIVAISALAYVGAGISDVLGTVSNGFGPQASAAAPTATPKPTKTPKPMKTPKPTKTPKP
jgi:Flp pilus assembly pilin Flp